MFELVAPVLKCSTALTGWADAKDTTKLAEAHKSKDTKAFAKANNMAGEALASHAKHVQSLQNLSVALEFL